MPPSVSVKVAVRMRPFNKNEEAEDAKAIIDMSLAHKQITIKNPSNPEDSKSFTYDFLYNSLLPVDDPDYASQDTVWNDLGNELLEAAWAGYNYSLFAYGQTGSGKSHSMVGFGSERGVIPRACEAIFAKINEGNGEAKTETTYKVEASMLEIYNERIRDLFVPMSQQPRGGLKIRDSPTTGAYVDNLKKIPVIAYHQIERLMTFGTKNRTVAATNMNETSSRAHTIFTITFVQTTVNRSTMKAGDIRSSINLVDLAGSERVARTGATGDRLTEGGHINKSLSALGNVINALAKNGTQKKQMLVPYRDAVLTHLLKNSLGGNAKTTMIAAVSPADSNYAESLSTLRYADRAKNIKNVAIVNEDANEALIKQLRKEMEELKRQLERNQNVNPTLDLDDEREKIKRELEEKFKRDLQEKQAQWESEQKKAEEFLNNGREEEGDKNCPYLVNLNEDAALSGVLVYRLRLESENWIGVNPPTVNSDARIIIGGMGVMAKHACLTRGSSSALMLSCMPGARTLVNGVKLVEKVGVKVRHMDRIIFGNNSVFKVVLPGGEDIGVEVDWEFAMKEANSETLKAMSSMNDQKMAEETSAREEMERKVALLESELKRERDKSGEDQNEMMKQQKDLEIKLKSQIEATERLLKKQERERQERSLVDRQLLHTLPLVHEAN